MQSLAELLALPTWIGFSGRQVAVSPMRIRSIARLETWTAALAGCPVDAVRDILDGPDELAALDAAYDVLDAAEAGPPRFGERRFAAALSTPEGKRMVSRVLLTQDGVMVNADADVLIDHATEEEHVNLWRVGWGVSPLSLVHAIIEGPPAAGSPDKAVDWPRLHAAVVDVCPMTIEQFADLTFAQAVAIASKGKPATSANFSGDLATEARRRRERYQASVDRRAARRAQAVAIASRSLRGLEDAIDPASDGAR